MTTWPRRVQIVEVGPRDGLQNEPALVPAAEKIAFIDRLAAAGHTVIEAAAFVSPTWVPQMADAADVFAGISRPPGVRYAALIPNLTGLRRALEARADEIAIFVAASQTFSRKNVNQTVAESLITCRAVCEEAAVASVPVRAYLSTSFGCPFEGTVPVDTVCDLTARLVDMGAYQVALSDTIGVAHPGQVSDLVGAATRRVPVDRLALHLHDTRGTALVNVYAGLQAGVTTFDASAGGLGGCPFAPGATGNLATEDVLYLLDGLGIETGVSLPRVMDASRAIEAHVGHVLPSRVLRATQPAVGSRQPAAGHGVTEVDNEGMSTMDTDTATLLIDFIEKVGLLRREMQQRKDFERYEARFTRVQQKLDGLAERISRTDPELAKALRTAWQFPARSLAYRNAKHQKELKAREDSEGKQ